MYAKLFGSILTSSVWSQESDVRVVWITLLALADREGRVRASASGLARLSNVSPEACQRALDMFIAPDTESGTQEFDGRRIEEIPAGWLILNYVKYRDLKDEETRKAQWRESSKRYRQQKSARRHRPSARGQRESAPTDTAVDTETEKSNSIAPASGANVRKATWLTPFLDAWTSAYGGALSPGQAAKALAPIYKQHDASEVLRRWRIYLHATGASFASPQKFASTFGEWAVAPRPAVKLSPAEQMAANLRTTFTPVEP
jgi:hypothetical protein